MGVNIFEEIETGKMCFYTENPASDGINLTETDVEPHFAEWNPHKEECRHYLVEMLRKLNNEQWIAYCSLMDNVYRKQGKRSTSSSWGFWMATSPSEIMFDCICSVIE